MAEGPRFDRAGYLRFLRDAVPEYFGVMQAMGQTQMFEQFFALRVKRKELGGECCLERIERNTRLLMVAHAWAIIFHPLQVDHPDSICW